MLLKIALGFLHKKDVLNNLYRIEGRVVRLLCTIFYWCDVQYSEVSKDQFLIMDLILDLLWCQNR